MLEFEVLGTYAESTNAKNYLELSLNLYCMEWDNLMNPAFYALCVQQDAQLFTTGKFVGIVFLNTLLFDVVLRINTQLWNTSWTTNI